MSLRSKRYLSAGGSWLIAAVLLTGCGLQPLYGKHTGEPDAAQHFAAIKIDHVTGRMSQQFKQNLEDRLNPQGTPPDGRVYRLTVTLVTSSSPIDVAPNGNVSRYNVYIDSHYALYDPEGKQVTSGSLRNVNSYNNVVNAYFSTYVSQDDAISRGLVELSEMYRQRLAAYLVAPPPLPKVLGKPAGAS